MKLIAIILSLICSSAFASANSYDLKIDLYLNGKQISSSNAVVKAGEISTITQKTETQQSSITLVANERSIQNHNLIWMAFSVRVDDRNGQRVIEADHQIYAKENEPMHFTAGNENGNQISLSVVAKRKID